MIAAGLAAVALAALLLRTTTDSVPVAEEGPLPPAGGSPEDAPPVHRKAPIPWKAPKAPAEETAAPDPPAPREKAPRVVVSGRVVGPSDQGIDGAAVSLFTGEDAGGTPEGSLADLLSGRLRTPRPSSTVVTGKDGGFRLEITPAALASLVGEKEGWAPARIERVELRTDAEGILLRLSAPAPVAGTVVRAGEGERVPVAGASVIVFAVGADRLAVLASATTGENGRYAAVGAPAGEAGIAVLAKGMKPVLLSKVPVPDEDRVIPLEPAVLKFVRGEVFLPGGTTPAGHVKVVVTTRPGGRPAEAVQEATTDRQGRFAFEEVEAGEHCGLAIEFDGGARGFARLARYPWPGDSDERVTLEAVPAETLRGRAVEEGPDGTRRPVPGVRLVAGCLWESPFGRIARQDFDETAPDGTFEFHGMTDREVAVNPVDRNGPWAVIDPRFGQVPWKPASGPWEVELLLGPNIRSSKMGEVVVSGRVVGTDGQPVAGARVVCVGPPGFTDREGRFLLRGLVPREGRQGSIHATAEGFQPTRFEAVLLLPGADPTGMVLAFTGVLLPVRGRVVDEEDRPLAGAKVVLPRFGIAWTGPDGWWRAEGIPGSVSQATISLRGFRPAVIDEVQAGDAAETVVLVRE